MKGTLLSALCVALSFWTEGANGLLESNARLIEKLNAESTTAVFGANQFQDMTSDEFKARILLPPLWRQRNFDSNRYLSELNVSDLPNSFDWRDKGAVTAVKDQGTVGSCWAFSTTANIEGQWFINKGELPSLSEEFLVDCDSNDCGVFGGWPYLAYEYIISVNGVPSESAYPYCCGKGECYPCMANTNETFCGEGPLYCNATWNDVHCPKQDWVATASIKDWAAISKDETQMAAQMVNRGPLSVLLDATGLQHYKSGVWNPSGLFSCTTTDLDHAVLIVGYGTDSGTDYWTVKNSWGAKWGENGYFRIIRGKGKCGINTAVTTSCVNECS